MADETIAAPAIIDSSRPDLTSEHWKIRVVFRSGGRETSIGALVMAILGHGFDADKKAMRFPSFGFTAKINVQGWVVSDVWNRRREFKSAVPLFTVIHMRDALRRLADEIKCTDTERLEMFAEVSKWISVDERAISGDDTGKKRS